MPVYAISGPSIGFPIASAGGATFDFYISTTGSDTNPGTLASPWAITAINTKQATYGGKRLGIIAGTYNIQALAASSGSGANGYTVVTLQVNGGSSSAPTYVGSSDTNGFYSRGAATITCKVGSTYGNPNNNNGSNNARAGNPMLGFWNQGGNPPNPGYVTIDGLVLTGNISGNIIFGNAGGPAVNGITIKNCEFHDNNGTGSETGDNLTCISLGGCIGALVSNCYFHDCVGYTSGTLDHLSAILSWGGSSPSSANTLEFNTCINCGGIYGKESTQNGTTIRYNYVDISMFNSGDTAFSAISDWAEGNNSNLNSIFGNILIGMHPLSFIANLGGGTTSPVTIYNNTVVLTHVTGSADYYGIASSVNAAGTVSQYNNIVYNNTGGSMNEGYALHTLATLTTIDYNLYCQGSGSDHWTSWTNQGAGTAYTSLAAWQTATGGESHSVAATTSPLFTGSGATHAATYQLQAGSAAKNLGRTGGTSAGSTVDAGAWGIASQIGCSFGP